MVTRLLSLGITVAFIDLNYDPYIEMALADFETRLKISSMLDYVANGRQAIVCKVHGSIYWGTPLPSDRPWKLAIREFNPRARVETRLAQSLQSVRTWAEMGTPLYPVLTAPLAGKGPMDLVCPRAHVPALTTFLKDCRHYLVIGTSAQDADLLDLLRGSVPEVRVVHYVSNSGPDGAATRDRLEKSCPQFKTQNAVVFGNGFRAYLGSNEFEALLR